MVPPIPEDGVVVDSGSDIPSSLRVSYVFGFRKPCVIVMLLLRKNP
jgi:hypothetical protein